MTTRVVTVDEYREMVDQYLGICLACGELREGTEPDAEGYKCPACGECRVMGAEDALVTGNLELSEA